MINALQVLVLLAGVALSGVSPVATEAGWKAPLSTRGRYIVDADGHRFKLKSGNWHGRAARGTVPVTPPTTPATTPGRTPAGSRSVWTGRPWTASSPGSSRSA